MSRWIVCALGGSTQRLRRIAVEPGSQITVGRSPSCELAIDDPTMAGEHCVVRHDGERVLVCPHDSELGTLLQGKPVQDEAEVLHGEWVRAARTELLLFEEGLSARLLLQQGPAHDSSAEALSALRAELPLYAVFDAARDIAALQLLRESDAEASCLFDEPQATELASVAPYLVALEQDDALLASLVQLGWGNGWGVYLRYGRPLSRLRAQLQATLVSANPDSDEPAIFRFYDPRVLREHLPACSARQRDLFFGGIDAFWLEDGDGAVLHLPR